MANRGNILPIATVLLLLLMEACTPKSLKPKDYISYLEDEENGLTRKNEINHWQYTLQYEPRDLILLRENKVGDLSRTKELDGTLHFKFQFRYLDAGVHPLKINIKSMEEYNQRLNYFLNQAQKDFTIEYQNTELHPIGYLFETQFGLVPYETINLIFALPDGEKSLTHPFEFKYVDHCFGNGIIKYSFNPNAFEKVPKLNR